MEDWEWLCNLCQNVNDIEDRVCACCGETKGSDRDFSIPDRDVPRVITRHQRYEVLKRQGWVCNNCHANLKYSKTHQYGDVVGHIDHIHPYSERDSYPNGRMNINETCNLQALCPECNLRKNKRKIN